MNLKVELKREKENVIHTKLTLWLLVYCSFENEIFPLSQGNYSKKLKTVRPSKQFTMATRLKQFTTIRTSKFETESDFDLEKAIQQSGKHGYETFQKSLSLLLLKEENAVQIILEQTDKFVIPCTGQILSLKNM